MPEYKKSIYDDKPDFRSHKSMRLFLARHEKYWRLNSWNRLKAYAHNVKIQNLQLPELTKEQEEVMWALLDPEIEHQEYDDAVQEVIDGFKEKHPGWEIMSNGRSAGYLILVDTEHPEKVALEDEEDALTWCMTRLKDQCEAVHDFDITCDKIRKAFIETILHSQLDETTELVPVTKRTVTTKQAL